MITNLRILAATIAALTVACEDKPASPTPDSSQSSRNTATARTSAPTGGAVTQPPGVRSSGSATGSATMSATPSAAGDSAATPSDEQILMILDASNDKEIEESKAVVDKLADKDLKAFAQMMTEHHGEAKTKAKKLADDLKLKPAEAEDAKKLKEDTSKEVERLKKLTGAELDKEYAALMLKDHQQTLADLDKKILPNIQHAELKKMVENDLKPTVQAHLKAIEGHAKRLGVQTETAK